MIDIKSTLAIIVTALLACSITADQSRISDSLTYDTEHFDKSIRVIRGYPANMKLFKINIKAGAQINGKFTFTIKIPDGLAKLGEFKYIIDGKNMPISNLIRKRVGQDSTEYSLANTNHDLINQLLDTLTYTRSNLKIESGQMYQVEYLLENESGKYDQWIQAITLPAIISYEAIQTGTSTMLPAGKEFSIDLYRVTESQELINDLNVRMHSSFPGKEYLQIDIVDGIVKVHGITPTSMHQTSSGKYTITVVFDIVNSKTGDQTNTMTYYLELNPKTVHDSEVIAFYIYGSIFILFFLMVAGFVVCAIKRDHQLKKESVRQTVQQEAIPQENVLTQSILLWNKSNSSTADQTNKGQNSSMMSNGSANKFALGKGKKPSLTYKNLRHASDKDNINNKSENSVEITGNLHTNQPSRAEDMQESSKNFSQNEDFDNQGDGEQGNRSNGESPNSVEQRGKDASPGKPGHRDIHNLSHFDLSRIDALDSTMRRAHADFNDMSVSRIGLPTDKDQDGNNEGSKGIKLDEMNIILEGL